ncbi:hypothetical protein ABKV19_026316 [Rosa sericea]
MIALYMMNTRLTHSGVPYSKGNSNRKLRILIWIGLSDIGFKPIAELHIVGARRTNADDTTDDDLPSTSECQFTDAVASDSAHSNDPKHFGQSPLPAYQPAFDWESERSLICGQRVPETPISHGLKISVKVLSLSFQAGLVEPFYATICLYNRERREKLSEDFYFRHAPTETHNISFEPRGIFYLDAPSSSVCLLIQLEKHATEEGGVTLTPTVYSRKEPAL